MATDEDDTPIEMPGVMTFRIYPASTAQEIPMSDDTTTPTKPGWKTTEFWLKCAAILLTALFASGVIPTSGPAAMVTAIAATMLGALGYTVSRTVLKAGTP